MAGKQPVRHPKPVKAPKGTTWKYKEATKRMKKNGGFYTPPKK